VVVGNGRATLKLVRFATAKICPSLLKRDHKQFGNAKTTDSAQLERPRKASGVNVEGSSSNAWVYDLAEADYIGVQLLAAGSSLVPRLDD
jgi:hypothetical protein